MDDVFADALKQFLARWERASETGAPPGIASEERTLDAAFDSHSRYLRAVWMHLHAEASRLDRPVYIYGAGAHSKWLLLVTHDLPRTHIKGFLDDAVPARTLGGFAVTAPKEAGVEDGAIVLISSDRYEADLYRRAQEHFGNRVSIVRLYEGLPTGPYPRPESPDSVARRRKATRRARARWGGSDFVGPYEQAGLVTGFLQEQWLWRHRHRLCGHVLDMSTPRHWHEWIYELPAVESVSISDLNRAVVMKGEYASEVHYKADFSAPDLSVAPATFDTVLCLSVLEHCGNPLQLIRNLHQVLTPAGTLMVVVPFAYVDGHCHPDFWRFGRDGLALLADKAGFAEKETTGLGDVGPFLEDVLGSELAADKEHHGIPLLNCLIATKASA